MKPTSAILRCPALAVAALVAATPAANPAPHQNPPDNHPVPLIVIDDVPLVDAIRNLARQAGGNYIIDPRVSGAPGTHVTIRFENVSAREALGALINNHKLTMVANPATTVARIAPAGLGVKPVPASQVGANTGAVIPLLVMDVVPLTEAVAKLAGIAPLTVSLDPKWAESADKTRLTVSFRWEKITARQALAALLDNYELELIADAGTSMARVTLKSQVSASPGQDGAGAGREGNHPAPGEVILPLLLPIEDYTSEQEGVFEEFTRTEVTACRNRDAYVLSELWQRGLLKDEIKERLVREHYQMVLVQIPSPLGFPNMEVRGCQTFPFPNIWTEFTPTLYVNDKVKWAPGKPQTSHSMSQNNSTITSWSGGEFKNGDVLRYKIELRQKARGSLTPPAGKAAVKTEEPPSWEIALWSNKIILQGIRE